MTYAIVYSSRTGNTERLAQAIRQALPPEECLYFGPPDPQARAAERIYVGFWTDKGDCDAQTRAFLSELRGKEIFLFGTAGFGGASVYFRRSSPQGPIQERNGGIRIRRRHGSCLEHLPRAGGSIPSRSFTSLFV